MSELVPLRADPRPPAGLEAAASFVRGVGSESLSPSRRQQLWGELVARADRTVPLWHRAVWAVPAAAALLLVGLWVRSTSLRPDAGAVASAAAPQEPPRVAPASGARYRLDSREDMETLTVDEGRVEIRVRHGAPPMRVAARELTVFATEGRFLTEVERSEAFVAVFEGSVVVRRGDKELMLAAGERAGESDRRLRATPPPPLPIHRPAAAPAVAACPSRAPLAERVPCLERAAQGAGLAAQNAQYALALVTEQSGDAPASVGAWRRYAERFPDGVLAPEARLALINELVKLERYPEALAEAETFLARYPGEPVAADVRRLTEHLRKL